MLSERSITAHFLTPCTGLIVGGVHQKSFPSLLPWSPVPLSDTQPASECFHLVLPLAVDALPCCPISTFLLPIFPFFSCGYLLGAYHSVIFHCLSALLTSMSQDIASVNTGCSYRFPQDSFSIPIQGCCKPSPRLCLVEDCSEP